MIYDEETKKRLNGNKSVNHVKSLAAHLLNSQYYLAKSVGLNTVERWAVLFAIMGMSEVKYNFEYPDIEDQA